MISRKILLARRSTDYIGGGLYEPILLIGFKVRFKCRFQHIRRIYMFSCCIEKSEVTSHEVFFKMAESLRPQDKDCALCVTDKSPASKQEINWSRDNMWQHWAEKRRYLRHLQRQDILSMPSDSVKGGQGPLE